MKEKKKRGYLIIFVCLLLFLSGISKPVEAAKKKTYTLSPNQIPSEVKRSSIYNKDTKNWLQIQYYLKKLQKGGGKLVLKKGTYKISNTLYVPSNTTIELQKGVVLKKISPKKAKVKPAKNMFVLVAYDKRNKIDASSKYNGPKNIKFIGHGKTSVIDLAYVEGAHGISASHNQDLVFENITFKGENGGHYIELAGTRRVTIRKNRFLSSKDSTKMKYYNKEAINIDTPDPLTGGFTLVWSKKDQTPNVDIRITNNTFEGVNRAIGTHKYSQKVDQDGQYSENSQNVYHQKITIQGNTFRNIFDNAIFIMNWKNTTIEKNSFIKIGNEERSQNTNTASHGIAGGGVIGLNVTKNRFEKILKSAIYLKTITNNKSGSEYYPTDVFLTEREIQKMSTNTVDKRPFGEFDLIVFSNRQNTIPK